MKILLDENLPHRLRQAITNHIVVTVAFQGWSGVKNGELLRLAEANGFDILMTADRNLAYQQNLEGRVIALVCLTASDWEILSPHIAEILLAIGGRGTGLIPGCRVRIVSEVAVRITARGG